MKIQEFWLSTSAVTLTCCGIATAQTTTTPDSSSGTTLQEVVVTAERRQTDLQKTAVSATVAGFAVTLPRPPATPADTMRIAEDLTARELEVLRLMARGQTNKQVAAELKISEHTAKFHVSSVLAKLGALTRTEAVTIGMTRGLVAI